MAVKPATWAMIQNGKVVNVVLASYPDLRAPGYTWVDVTNASPMPAVGWSYNGTTFSPPPVTN